MVINALAVVVVACLLWLCRLLWLLYTEDERARTLARLAAAAEQAYAMEPETPGLKFSWVMHRAKARYPRVEYDRLGEEIQAALWEIGTSKNAEN
jgi:hypothetical protein